jgi:uncharacterized coiled-coil protein SlyX
MTAQDTEIEELATRLAQLEERVRRIERAFEALSAEVRTRQLVVVDDEDHPRIVGEVFADTAELRLELPVVDGEPGPELLLFAITSSHPGPADLGPAVGMQLRAQGLALFELDAWPGPDGVWRPHLHLTGP